MGCQRFKVHLTFWYNSIIFVPSNLSKSLFPFLLTHTHPHVYGFHLLNTLISCQLNCGRDLAAFSLLCFLCSLIKLSMPFKIYSINFNFVAITEWIHYQLICFCSTEVFLYLTRAQTHPIGVWDVDPPDLELNQHISSRMVKELDLVHRPSFSSFFQQQLLLSTGNHSALYTLERATAVKDFSATFLGCYISFHRFECFLALFVSFFFFFNFSFSWGLKWVEGKRIQNTFFLKLQN